VSDKPPTDTSHQVRDLLIARWREMSPLERAVVASDLTADIARLAVAGIRLQRPEIAAVDLAHELTRRRYGAPLADAAFRQPSNA
jgi:hypothetical protein